MKFFRFLCLLPAMLVLLAACKVTDSPAGPVDPVGNITTTVAGVVQDEAGQPVAGAKVRIHGIDVTTNKFGSFMLKNASVPSDRCFILCEKSGYFTGSRAEIPKVGGVTEMRLTLQSNAAGYSINAATGGTVTIGSASVKFPAAAFVTASGAPFTGTVKVAAKFLDPSQRTFYNSFSGDMSARRIDGSQTELLSYGVLRVQITDGSGNKLALASGKTATLTYPIASSLQSNAPVSMPLWYFDEAIGMWKEEGTVAKSGNAYTGEVSHFTDWNCDYPGRTGTIKGRVLCSNEGVPGVYVTVGQRKVVTDSAGYFTRRVPMNTDFVISVNPAENGGITAPDVAVPALSDGEERAVTVQLTTCPALLTGVLVDCNDAPVAGTIVVSYSGIYAFHFTTTGEFKMRVPSGVALTVEATTFEGKLALMQSVGVLNSGDKKDVGHLSACENGTTGDFYDINLGVGYTYSTVLSPDGSLIAINGYRKALGTTFTGVYDTKTGTTMFELTQDSTAQAINFSDDGTKLLIRWRSDSALVVNPLTGAVIQRFNDINDARMLPDGSAIIGTKNSGNGGGSLTMKLRMYSMADGSKIKDLSFNESGSWLLIGIRSNNQVILLDPSKSQTGVRIVHWDIATDAVVSDITIPDTYYYSGGAFSQDYSVIALNNLTNMAQFNFYNSYTAAKVNTSPFTFPGGSSQREAGSMGVANDQTFAAQGMSANGQAPVAPSTFSMMDGKMIKILATPSQSAIYRSFGYSANSQYLSAIQQYYTVDPGSVSVRIWKVK
ncbi:MAG: carboxypeptidase-like regulatory domain-containing protein [Candidatus Kapaibacterium sp.]